MGDGDFQPPKESTRLNQPITKQFVTGDYVGDLYNCAKFGAHPSTGGSGRMVEI